MPARRRRGVLTTLIGTAAAAVLSVLFLATGSIPQDAQAATVEPTTTSDSGWVSVPATPPHVSTTTRKFVSPTTASRAAASSSTSDAVMTDPPNLFTVLP